MKILIPVDGSSFSQAAVRFIASRTTPIGKQPDVELLNVQLPVPSFAADHVGQATVLAYYKAEANDVIRPALARLKKAGLSARAGYVVGSPGQTVARRAAAANTDLIVMGSHGRTALKGWLFGSVTTAVLSSCTTPLLVVRGGAAPKKDSLRVGIAVDGSRYGIAAVRYVLKHRDLFGAAPLLTLIHVVPDFFSMVLPGMGDAPVPVYKPDQVVAMQKKAFEAALKSVRKLVAAAGLHASEVRLIGNNAGDEIAAYAKKNKLDLLVMGSHGYGGFKSAVLGSVAIRVAARCQTPLLLIRAK